MITYYKCAACGLNTEVDFSQFGQYGIELCETCQKEYEYALHELLKKYTEYELR